MKTRSTTKSSSRRTILRRPSPLPATTRRAGTKAKKTSARSAARTAGRGGSKTSGRGSMSAARTSASRSTKRKASPARSSGRTSRSAKTTTDHEEIMQWAESRGGKPATVKRTVRGKQSAGVLRIDFPGFSGAQTLKPISWDEWFQVFDQRKLALIYQDVADSRFNKLVRRKK